MKELKVYNYGIGIRNKPYWLSPDGILHKSENCETKYLFNNSDIAQQSLDKWTPQEKWLAREEVKKAAKKSDKTALLCSIEHWKQVLLNPEEGNYYIGPDYCAVCMRARYGGSRADCKKCVLGSTRNKYDWDYDCCREYEEFQKDPTTENAIAMYNRLVKIYNERFKNMKNVDVKLEQCRNDIKKLQEEEQRLLTEKEKDEIEDYEDSCLEARVNANVESTPIGITTEVNEWIWRDVEDTEAFIEYLQKAVKYCKKHNLGV